MLRILFAADHAWLLAIVGLLLIAGGLLLLWVCWKMWRELRSSHAEEHEATEALSNADYDRDGTMATGKGRARRFAQAAWQIVIADVSMSLDNVLAVAGAAMRPSDGADHRPGAVDCADGLRRALCRTAAAPLPLDRLYRPR